MLDVPGPIHGFEDTHTTRPYDDALFSSDNSQSRCAEPSVVRMSSLCRSACDRRSVMMKRTRPMVHPWKMGPENGSDVSSG
jgi:hypothetical protein